MNAGITDSIANENQSYAYDALDRLTSWTLNGSTESYGYDAATGNLQSKGGVQYAYSSSHVHAVESLSNGNTYQYDANGNQTKRTIGSNVYDLAYDAENRLVEVKKNSEVIAQFVYDGDGKQVKATINNVTTTYVGSHYEIEDDIVAKYYFAGSTRIAFRKDGMLSYLLTDHLGSSSIATDSAGAVTAQMWYGAWGNTRHAIGSLGMKYEYTSQRNESEIGLHFYNARWYDPSLSRFAQADSIVPDGVQGYDRYAYVNNSPIMHTDPSGYCLDQNEYYCRHSADNAGNFVGNGEEASKGLKQKNLRNAPTQDILAFALEQEFWIHTENGQTTYQLANPTETKTRAMIAAMTRRYYDKDWGCGGGAANCLGFYWGYFQGITDAANGEMGRAPSQYAKDLAAAILAPGSTPFGDLTIKAEWKTEGCSTGGYCDWANVNPLHKDALIAAVKANGGIEDTGGNITHISPENPPYIHATSIFNDGGGEYYIVLNHSDWLNYCKAQGLCWP